jgi:hypothetical protein
MKKGSEVKIDPEVVREQGEFLGYLEAPLPARARTAVYWLDGDMLFMEEGASKTFVFEYVGNPLDLYRGDQTIADRLGY